METDTLTNEQVDVHVDPKVVKIMTETNMIPAANVSNRNHELKEYGNSLNKSVLELNIAEQVALPSIENPSRLSRSSQPSMTMEARSWTRELQKSKQIAYLIYESLSDVLWPFVQRICWS